MLFNSNFSFTSSSRRRDRVNSRNIQHHGEGGIGVNHEVSPHSTMDTLNASWGRRRGSSSIKRQDDRLSVISSSASVTSRDSDSTIFSSRRSTISVNEATEKMKFSVRRRQSNNPNASNQIPEKNTGPVIASALTMDIASLRRQQSKPKKISVPARTSSLSRTSRVPTPTSPTREKVTRRRAPTLELEPPSPRSSESLHEIDHSLLSPFQARPPSANTHIGIQMLLNTLDGDSDEEDENEPEVEEQSCQTLVNTTSPVSTSGNRPPRIEVPMPPIDESGETTSECSSDSDTSNRRHSTVSTVPTSVSGSSTPSLSIPKNRRSVSSARSYQDLSSASTVHQDMVATKPRSLSEIISPSSRRSSSATAATFFCRGNRNSFLSNSTRFSIGLGSIAGSDIDLEAGLEDSTHFPGIDELKKQISWLSLRGTQIYDSDDDDDEDDGDDSDDSIEDYHQFMSSMVPRESSVSSASVLSRKSVSTKPTTPASKSHSAPRPPPSGPVLQAPTRRRERRRTASSECIVLDALQEIRASIGTLQPSVAPVQKYSKGVDFWDDSIIEDPAARDQILRSSALGSRI
ncbi:hypothetical protein K440DRAFT_610444 [Wilcoxina mikolae CBS 423.85]|nr:hypothetical protein K440DRAFT_610444 [Wilcoxina mikolae CBS 423.85]